MIKMTETRETVHGSYQRVLNATGANGTYAIAIRFDHTGKTNHRTGREIIKEIRVLTITRPTGEIETYETETLAHAKKIVEGDLEMFSA